MRLPLRPHSGSRARFFTLIPLWVSALLLCILAACSSARHVPQDELINYVRQLPNHKLLWSIKFQLGIYNMSGHDTTKWYNRWVAVMGDPIDVRALCGPIPTIASMEKASEFLRETENKLKNYYLQGEYEKK